MVLMLGTTVFSTVARAQLIPGGSEHTLVAEKDVKIEDDARVMGSVHANEKVEVKKDATVLGDVTAGDEIKNDGTILGSEMEGAADVSLPNFDADDLRGMATRTFDDDYVFGDEVVDDIVFVDGKATIDGPVTGSGMILAASDVIVDADIVGQSGPTLVAVQDVKIEKDKGWYGILIAGKSVKLEDDSRLEGRAFAHDKVEIKKQAQVIGEATEPPAEIQKPFILVDPSSQVYRLLVALVGKEIKIDKDSVVTGNIHSNDKIDVKKDGLVDGDASAVGDIKGDGEVTGASQENAPPQVLPGLPSASSLQGLADRVFSDDATFTNETIDDVVFVFGKVEIKGSLRGSGTIIASDEIRFKGSPGAVDPESRLSLISYDDIKIDKDWTFRGALRAAEDIKLDKNTVVRGIAIAGDKLDIKKEVLLSFEEVIPPEDVTVPTLDILAPTAIEILDDTTPEIRLAFEDPESDIDLATLTVTIDDFDILAGCAVEPTGAVCEPPALAEGRHTLLATVRNNAGLQAGAHHIFELYYDLEDIESPTLTLVEPIGDPPIDEHRLMVRLEYSDADSGIDLSSFALRIGDLEVTETCQLTVTAATCEPWALTTGVHFLTAEVRDLVGNEATVELEVTITSSGSDTVRPTLEILEPASETVIDGSAPSIVIAYADGGTGIDRSSLRVVVDAIDITAHCRIEAQGATCPGPPLAAGEHRVTAQVKDLEGNGLLARNFFEATIDTSDTTPPTILFLAPGDEPVLAYLFESASMRLEDAASGVDLSSVIVELDGRDITPDCFVGLETQCEIPFLGPGIHRLTVRMADMVGNVAVIDRDYEVLRRLPDSEPPTLEIRSPTVETAEGPFTVRLAYNDVGGARIDVSTLSVTLDGQALTCTARAITAECPLTGLVVGSYQLEAQIADGDGNGTTAALDFAVVAEQRPPSIFIETPTGVVMGESRPEILVHYSDVASGIDVASFRLWIDDVEITTGCVVEAETAVCQPPSLAVGSHQLIVEIADLRGNVGRDGQVIEIQIDLGVEITSPEAGLLTRSETVTVEGVLSQAVGQVVVSGGGTEVEAQVDGLAFVAVDVPLMEGTNVITAVARAGGAIGLATVNVVRDTQPPSLAIRYPRNGAVVGVSEIMVTGEIIDPLPGHLEAPSPEVEVGGLSAELDHGTFLVEGYLLQSGDNRIVVTAIDAAGNRGSAEVRVRSIPSSSAQIEIVGGQGQRAAAGSSLAEPLAVRLVDGAGRPLAGRPVTFAVRRGTGHLTSGVDEGRQLAVTTDVHGLAAASFTLGDRAGLGNHEVAVSSPGFAAPAVFFGTAEVSAPRRIVPVVGGDQSGVRRGAVGREYLQPLLAQVFDAYGNPLAGVTVTFRSVLGGGTFVGNTGDAESIETVTDSDGIAAVRYVLGPKEGIGSNLVEASFEDLVESPATFVLSSLEPGPESSTRLSGLVLDNQDQPVPGVTLKVAGQTAVADAEGRFQLQGVAAGWIHLDVDGSTTTRPGTWPHLEFAFQTVAGRNNSLGMPIRLPRIDAEGARVVGGDQEVEIPLAGVPGASLTVFANSTVFPDGSTSGDMSFSQVLSDKVPMVAPLGSGFAVAFTIQPPGVHFDPPARLQIPNLGLDPGAVVDIFSFDHDLGEFVTAGSAAVTDDGRFLRSEPGFGIHKSGWGGCVTPPASPGDACRPGVCTVCVDKKLESRCSKSCQVCTGDGCDDLNAEEITAAANGKTVDDKVIVGVGQEVDFKPMNNEGDCVSFGYAWDFGDAEASPEMNMSTDEAPSHKYKTAGEKTITLIADCEDCSAKTSPAGCTDCPGGTKADDSIKIKVVKLTFEGAFERLDTASEDMLMVEREDIDGDGKKDDFFRVLGGVRVRLKLEEHPDLSGKIQKLTWSGSTGKFFDGFASTAKELTGDDLSGAMLDEVFWQGPWMNGLQHELKVTAELNDMTKVEGPLLLVTRELKGGVSKGDDISMLQYLLRVFGLSESASIGYAGSPVSVDRDFGDRTRHAVRRFRVRDELLTCGATNREYKICITGASEIVDTKTLEALETHWKDFQAAQEAFSMNKTISSSDPRLVAQWVPLTSLELQKTYTTALHTMVAPGHDYNRLVEEWLRKEGSLGHWGRKGIVDFRIVLGGADELGSIGFSQITNTNRYGPTTISGITAYNLYEPEDNCVALAAFSNSPGQGMHRAFDRGDYKRTVSSGYPRIGATYTDTTHDLLSKAVAAYNGGPGQPSRRRVPWPFLLKDFLPPVSGGGFSYRNALDYSLTIQTNSGVSRISPRCWTWTDRVITTGPDDVCDTAVSVVPPDQVLTTSPFDPPSIPSASPHQPCVAAGTPGESMIAVPLGNDEYREFSFEYCASQWENGTSWGSVWYANLPATIP